MLLTGCITTKETVKLVYVYPVVMAPSVDEIPKLPEYNFETTESLPEYVILPVDDAVNLGRWIIEMQKISALLREKLLYYIKITDWGEDDNK